MNQTLLRELIPAAAVQEALIRAVATWPTNPPADPKGWLTMFAWRKFLDATRTEPPGTRVRPESKQSHRPVRPRRVPVVLAEYRADIAE